MGSLVGAASARHETSPQIRNRDTRSESLADSLRDLCSFACRIRGRRVCFAARLPDQRPWTARGACLHHQCGAAGIAAFDRHRDSECPWLGGCEGLTNYTTTTRDADPTLKP